MVEAAVPVRARTFGALFRTPYRYYLQWLYERLRNEGFSELRLAHSAVFRTIPVAGGRITDMADSAGITKQSMAYLVDYVEKHGYVETAPDPKDQRAKLVLLTKRGRHLLATAGRLGIEFERHVSQVVGERDAKELRRILERLGDAVDAGWRAPSAPP
jgi:DNA-binding MarR family transcriptional regulator